MNYQEIIALAAYEGFFKAEIIDTPKIIFCPEFRKYCEENLCGKYDRNYSCPPDCGTPDQMRDKVMKYKKALVLQTCWKIDDFSQTDKLNSAKAEHNGAMLRLIKKLKSMGYDGLMAGASGCSLCKACEKENNKPCKHPDLSFSCLSAYCINVKRLAEECSMNYDYKDGVLSFFGIYLFQK